MMEERLSSRHVMIGAAAAVAAGGAARLAAAPAPSILTGAQALARAQDALGRKTRYAQGDGMPEPGRPWPIDPAARTDCSGFILWSFGLGRDQRLGGGQGRTDDIYEDALTSQQLFARIDAPRVGGIIIYPKFRISGAVHDAGHVALIAGITSKTGEDLWDGAVKERLCLDLIDCSSTAYWTYGDAVSHGSYLKFLMHDQLISYAVSKDSKLGRNARAPIYAISKTDT